MPANRGKTRKRRVPPPEHRFKPGQSGNPSGRPKGSGKIRQQLEAILDEKLPGDPQKRTLLKALCQRLVQEGIRQADSRRFEAIRDTIDGKPPQAVTGEAGGPMRVHVTIERIGGDEDKD